MAEENFTFELPEFDASELSDFVVEEEEVSETSEGSSTKEETGKETSEGSEGKSTETTEKTEEKTEEEHPSSKGIDSSLHKSASITLAKALHEGGYLSDFDEKEIEEGGIESVFSLLDKETDLRAQKYIDSLDDDLKDIVEARAAGVNLDDYKRVKLSELKLVSITDEQIEENQPLREKLLTAHFKATTSLSDEKIKKYVDRSIDLDEDVSDAKEAQKELLKIDKLKQAEMKRSAIESQTTRQKDAKKKLSLIQSQIDEMKEIIPDVKLNSKDRQNLYKTLTEVVETVSDNGQNIPMNAVMANRAKNPVQWDIATAYLHDIGYFNFDKSGAWKPDFSKLTKTSKSNIMKDLEKVLASEENISQSKGTSGDHGFGESDLDNLTFPIRRGKGF